VGERAAGAGPEPARGLPPGAADDDEEEEEEEEERAQQQAKKRRKGQQPGQQQGEEEEGEEAGEEEEQEEADAAGAAAAARVRGKKSKAERNREAKRKSLDAQLAVRQELKRQRRDLDALRHLQVRRLGRGWAGAGAGSRGRGLRPWRPGAACVAAPGQVLAWVLPTAR
jgi:hypothetical protein